MILQCTKSHLDGGRKMITACQKHIKIADHSDLGCVVVEAYMDDELLWLSERKLYKANRKVLQAVKRKLADTTATAAKKRATVSGEPQTQGTWLPVIRPPMVGLCYKCGEMGHLVVSCPKPKQQYPFEQSLVKGMTFA